LVEDEPLVCDSAVSRLSMVSEAWLSDGALRKGCEAMDCAVVSVFFTR
jgi:hypothetical protein